MNKVAVASVVQRITGLLFYLASLFLLTAVGMELASRLTEKHYTTLSEAPAHFPLLMQDADQKWQVVHLDALPKNLDYASLLPAVGRGHLTGSGSQILANYQVEAAGEDMRRVTLQWVTDDYTLLANYVVGQNSLLPRSLRRRGVGEAVLGFVGAWVGIALFRRWRRGQGA